MQFAHILINYDLPWNPMKVEQRIGRIDRIGQKREVLIFNFRVRNTIEERVLEVLDDRIGLFENAVGGLEPILGDAEEDIRKALRVGAEKRERAMEKVGRDLQRRVDSARQADVELADLYFDSHGYQQQINELIGRAEVPSVSQEVVDKLVVRLLEMANAKVTPPGDGRRFPLGQRAIEFHPPFTEDERELLDGQERRLACFDPADSG